MHSGRPQRLLQAATALWFLPLLLLLLHLWLLHLLHQALLQ